MAQKLLVRHPNRFISQRTFLAIKHTAKHRNTFISSEIENFHYNINKRRMRVRREKDSQKYIKIWEQDRTRKIAFGHILLLFLVIETLNMW